ncbi:MAG TPA: DUF4293 domain-containing protein [Chryseolinea sp.]|nr:DUF4293 domain-containing protein [Chryseolinea sp.]
MWQRIQTVFLAISVIILLTILVLPIWMVDVNGETTVLTPFYLMKSAGNGGEAGASYQYIPYSITAVLAIASVTLSLISITKYKSRVTQMKIGALNSFFLVGVILSSFYLSNQLIKSVPDSTGQYGLAMWLPAISVLCNLLANRFIRRDEKLVRDSSRLR